MRLQIRDRVYDITEEDVFMYNGYCFQLMTRKVAVGLGTNLCPEIVSIAVYHEWCRKGMLELLYESGQEKYFKLKEGGKSGR